MLATVGKQLRQHPALIPLFIFIGGGCTMCLAYLARLGIRSPEVSINKTGNPEPWNRIPANHQYKFYTVNMDYSKLKKQGPDF